MVRGSGVIKKIKEKIKIDNKTFASGPANKIRALSQLDLESKVFLICSSVKCSFSSGSCSINLFVIMETYPPSGSADIANSVPCLSSRLYITGPIPIENL